MKTTRMENAKLGLFVTAGALFLIFSLYMIGRNRNIFGATFTIEATFQNVNGLMPGNNVRFAGIDVGTVSEIELESDTAVKVTMVIDKKARKFIRRNAIASVGTDGLMGNKLININSQSGDSEPIREGDRLRSQMPVETDEMLRTLKTTNDNIAVITQDLRKITSKINNSTSLWKLLSDSTIARDIKQAAVNIKRTGENAALAGQELADLASEARHGNGLVGTLVADTALTGNLRTSLSRIQSASEKAVAITRELDEVFKRVKQGEGPAGALLSDTVMLRRLSNSFENIEEGTRRFNENMEAMRSNFLFRGYFKKMEKEEKKKN
jgi:phospholipid/cholesterol/gamma-HCH transport system substrate-binding protein